MTDPNDGRLSVDDAVEQTLYWVSYGEPNSLDLIDVATSNFPVMGKDGGFLANDARIMSRTEFVRDHDRSTCRIDVVSPDGTVTLVIDDEEETFDRHEDGVRAFFDWAAANDD